MDVNCGTILDGQETVEQAGRRIFDRILKVAGGERTKSEQFDFGSSEFAPWQIGATV
jgi:altronate hydrolase